MPFDPAGGSAARAVLWVRKFIVARRMKFDILVAWIFADEVYIFESKNEKTEENEGCHYDIRTSYFPKAGN